MSAEVIREFVEKLEIPEQARKELLALTPAQYIGNAVDQTEALR